MDNQLIPGIIFLSLVIWVLVLNLISRLTGWARLAGHYRSDETFQGKTWKFQSVTMRWGTGYNSSVNVGAGPQGLFLSVFFLFRPGHPSLFVRWDEVSVALRKSWIKSGVELRLKRARNIPLSITPNLAGKIARSAGSQWPEMGQTLAGPMDIGRAN